MHPLKNHHFNQQTTLLSHQPSNQLNILLRLQSFHHVLTVVPFVLEMEFVSMVLASALAIIVEEIVQLHQRHRQSNLLVSIMVNIVVLMVIV